MRKLLYILSLLLILVAAGLIENDHPIAGGVLIIVLVCSIFYFDGEDLMDEVD